VNRGKADGCQSGQREMEVSCSKLDFSGL